MLDIVIPNEVEAEYYTGIAIRTEEEAKKAADWFRGKGVKQVVITLAELGAFLSGECRGCLVPAFPVKAVDTTGQAMPSAAGFWRRFQKEKGCRRRSALPTRQRRCPCRRLERRRLCRCGRKSWNLQLIVDFQEPDGMVYHRFGRLLDWF